MLGVDIQFTDEFIHSMDTEDIHYPNRPRVLEICEDTDIIYSISMNGLNESKIPGVYFIYDNKGVLAYVGKSINCAINRSFTSVIERDLIDFCEVVCDDLAELSCYMKNPSFKEEVEVRIIYSPNITPEYYDGDLIGIFTQEKRFNNFVLNPHNYFARDDKIIGYADLSFEKLISRDIITEINIGPSSQVTEEDVFFLLVKYRYNAREVRINNSKSSYRVK
ncbi:hypothetical protein KPL47_07915 [Clostridium estertheticum]|uniref:hypothetical protein n=1 Tax=Clostridium estertheticum TaxID=238834 RepID=UPI001C0E7605|nr:hypothetical protein [Clostridium estertheticum]MBU3176295.1 hypothetical protein [Clostridium estertheticum]